MSSSPPDETSPAAPDQLWANATCGFVCKCTNEYSTPCANEAPFTHGGKTYCVLHYPSELKSLSFLAALNEKLERGDSDFHGAWFPDDLNLTEYTFSAPADFREAIFNGAETLFSYVTFPAGANFSYARFEGDVYFSYADFMAGGGAVFDNTAFKKLAYFRRASFHSEAKFESATFCGEADFTATTFRGATNFGYTTCSSYVKFSSEEGALGFAPGASLDFQYANLEKPERVSFNTLTLLPHWFVNVDSRKFDFFNVTWPPKRTVVEELKSLADKHVRDAHRRLAVAYRQLAVNAEENHRYGEASDFRFKAMDTRRREKARGYAFWTLDWWYWLASGYGEKVRKAFVILLVLWLLFAVPYSFVGFARWEPRLSNEADASDAKKAARDRVGKPLAPTQAIAYSFATMTLQRPEPRPVTPLAHFFVILETVLGPVQAALLALAIRRKFMR